MLVEDVGAGELRAHLLLVQLPLVVTATVLVRRPPTYCRICCPSHTGYSKIPERRESFEQAFPDVEIERPEGQSWFRNRSKHEREQGEDISARARRSTRAQLGRCGERKRLVAGEARGGS
jgi:hypothetical protein